MFSMPPARMTWAPPTTISWAAEMMACRPEPQTRLSVMAGTRLGRPALRATCRPGIQVCVFQYPFGHGRPQIRGGDIFEHASKGADRRPEGSRNNDLI